MGAGQIIGILLFWAAGMAAVYFWLRDPHAGVAGNLPRLGWALPALGAMAGVVIFAIALATTTGDVPERYW